MEREELEKLLESEDVQTVLSEKYVLKNDVEKLEGKKNQILGEKKKIQEKNHELEQTLAQYKAMSEKIGQLGFNPDEKFAEFIASLEVKPEGDVEGTPHKDGTKLEDRLVIQQRTYEARLEALKESKDVRIKELEDTLRNTVSGWDAEKIENALNHELDRIDVLPTHKKILKDAFRSLAGIEEDEDGVRSVQIRTEDGLQVSAKEYFDAFAQSAEGKAYIAAPTTTGGGALGGKGTRNTVDFVAERNKAMQNGDTPQSIHLALSEWKRRQKN